MFKEREDGGTKYSCCYTCSDILCVDVCIILFTLRVSTVPVRGPVDGGRGLWGPADGGCGGGGPVDGGRGLWGPADGGCGGGGPVDAGRGLEGE